MSQNEDLKVPLSLIKTFLYRLIQCKEICKKLRKLLTVKPYLGFDTSNRLLVLIVPISFCFQVQKLCILIFFKLNLIFVVAFSICDFVFGFRDDSFFLSEIMLETIGCVTLKNKILILIWKKGDKQNLKVLSLENNTQNNRSRNSENLIKNYFLNVNSVESWRTIKIKSFALFFIRIYCYTQWIA